MLVLSRKVNDKIIINDSIVLQILKLSGNRIQIGILAPKDVSIRRSELPQKEPEKSN